MIFDLSHSFASKIVSSIEARHACSRARLRYIARLRKPINGKIVYDSLKKKIDTRSNARAMQRYTATAAATTIECIQAKRRLRSDRASPAVAKYIPETLQHYCQLREVASCYEEINFFF